MQYLGDGAWGEDDSTTDDPGSIALDEALSRYDLVKAVHEPFNSFLIMSERKQLLEQPTTRELGRSSPSPWTSWTRMERNPELMGERGLMKFQDMRSDGTVRGALRLFKTPVVGARWYVEPGSDKDRDVKLAKRLTKMMDEEMTHGWPELLNEILLMCDYGHSVFEKVFTEFDDGFFGWKKLAPRHPLDIQEWVWDENGGPAGVRMKSEKSADGIFIPIEKLLIFTFDIESGDLRGRSLLRSAYKHWYYKENLYKIDAIQKERHGIGVPIIILPPGFTEDDKVLAEELGRNLRTNERAHVVLPANWSISFAKLEGQPVNALESIDHHNLEIAKNILAPFMGKDLNDKDQSLFMKSTKYLASEIASVITMYGFKQLVDVNFVRAPGYPKMRARRIGEWEDLRTLSFALRNLIGAGVIIPDDPLEASMRQEFDLPLADPETARIVRSPQAGPQGVSPGTSTVPVPGQPNAGTVTPPNAPTPPTPGRTGAPRQSPAGGMTVSPGSSRVGQDRSGG